MLNLHATLNRKFGDVSQPIGKYVLVNTLIATVPVVFFAIVAVSLSEVPALALLSLPDWRLGNPAHNFILGYADVVLLSPLVETALLIFLIKVLRFLRCPENLLPLLCGLAWGLSHFNYHGMLLGLSAAWPFYCYTRVIMAHEKTNLDAAWLLTSAIHGLTNLLGLTLGMLLNAISNA